MSLAIMRDDIQEHPQHKWLVVCPLILINNAWLVDAKDFVPELATISCHATTKAKRIKAINSEANIYVTNTESFVNYMEYFKAVGFHGCIVDESSNMKSPKSDISKALIDFSYMVDRFYILSGTPAPNGEYEYFTQMRSIDYYSMPASYSQFKQHYFVDISYTQFEKISAAAR